ncbi:MAG: zinc ABC transporter substrate-binding protein [Halobacteria archaeon]|nr:zinc ABC transporter substrate-binding protein [Halobacteria archaeon]
MSGMSRRRFLVSAGGLLGVGLTGCLGSQSQGTERNDVEASFFVAYDFARNISGEETRVGSLVPFGQHGHGWEPSAQIMKRVVGSDAFVYMGEGFQAWVDNVVRSIRKDHPDIEVIEAREGIQLMSVDEHQDEHEEGEENGHGDKDPDNSDTYEQKSEEYKRELTELDKEFEEGLKDRKKNMVVLAGHNSFNYLAERYGFEVHTPIGLSPDVSPGPQQIKRMREIVEENDLEYILTGALEGDRLARHLAEETGTEVLEVTPVAGVKEEWNEKEWGYVEQMRNINLRALEKALDARN